MKKRNKFLLGLLAGALAITSVFTLVGCNEDPPVAEGLTFNQAYDYSAVAGIGLLSDNVSSAGLVAQAANNADITDAEKQTVLANLAIAQGFKNGGVVRSTVTTSDRQGYEFYYTVTAADNTGASKVYEFYYNRTDITDNDDKAENEQEYRLNGLVILDGVEYTVIGEQEIEQGETEFNFEVKLNENFKVIIEQETDTNEEEFSYTVYAYGNKVFETEVEYEINKNGKIELEFETKDKITNIKQTYKFEFYTEANENFVKVYIGIGTNATIAVKIKITENPDGTPNYEFINGNIALQSITA